MMIVRIFIPFLFSFCPVTAEFYRLDNLLSDNPTFDSIDKQTGRELDSRKLSILNVGTLSSINATTDTCKVIGAGIRCDVQSVISAEGGDRVDVKIQVDCPLDSQIAFDFRRAYGCSCGAALKKFDGSEKFCPCIVCPLGFGNSPISIDCSEKEDPYIISTCTFLDCGFGCNGTCEFSCKNSGPSCSFCKDRPDAPTPAPTGPDGAGLPPSLLTSNGERACTLSAGALFLAGALSVLL
ncbi:hypothetical protein ACA910_012963 [Epithemia clementina (nom. ined.)]